MKKIYNSFFCIAITTMGFGQVTLQASDANAVIGESFDYNQTNWVFPGAAGADQIWDLSGLTTTASSSVNFTAANGSFPATNITYTDVNGGSLYLDHSSTGQDIHGMFDGGTTTITYSDAMTMMEFPLSVGANGTDSHMATFTSSGYAFTRAGSTTWEADGSGTIITPNGTYTDVLRVKQTQTYTDTYSLGTINYYVEIYGWYKAGIHHALASMTSITTDLGSNDYGTYLTGNVGLEELRDVSYSISPNPAVDYITIAATEGTISSVILSDISGKVVLESNENTINVADLNSGVYFVNVIMADGTMLPAQKIVKR